MRLQHLFAVTLSVMVLMSVVPATYVGIVAWQDYRDAKIGDEAMHRFVLSLKVGEKLAFERGTSDGLMTSPAISDRSWAARLNTQRANSDAALADLGRALSARGPVAAAAPLSAIAAKLKSNRQEIDQVAGTRSPGRDPAEVRALANSMATLVAAIRPTSAAAQIEAGRFNPDLTEILAASRRAADLREYAGHLGSIFAAPMAKSLPLLPDESLDVSRLTGQVEMLGGQLDERVSAAQVQRISDRAAIMHREFMDQAMNLVARVGEAGRTDANYPLSAPAFIDTYVPAMSSILGVRDAALEVAAARSERHVIEARRALVFAIALMILVLALAFGIAAIQRRRVLLPMLRLTKAVEGDIDAEVPDTEREDEVGELARAIRDAKAQEAENQRLRLAIDAERQAVVRSLAEQRTVLETSPHGIAMLKDRKVVSCNRACEAIFGYEPGEMAGLPTRALYASDEAYEADGAAMYASMIRGETAVMEMQVVGKDGHMIWLNISLAAIYSGNPAAGVIAAMEDITERRLAAERAREAFEVIADSIRYASRIQRSVLPESEEIAAQLSDYFVLWQPRDVVGGDIYWCVEWGDGVLIALGDCTGHGVPGAFVTMIASGAFEMARAEVTPGDLGNLVKRMHALIQSALKQHLEIGDGDDGMELGICYIPNDGARAKFVGARVSLFHAMPGEALVEYKGDRRGIGYRGIAADQDYTVVELDRSPGTRFYMSSDGLFDQIGGERNRAFGKSRFLDVLAEVGDQPMVLQCEGIEAVFDTYQGEQARRDDVTVVGFRMHPVAPRRRRSARVALTAQSA